MLVMAVEFNMNEYSGSISTLFEDLRIPRTILGENQPGLLVHQVLAKSLISSDTCYKKVPVNPTDNLIYPTNKLSIFVDVCDLPLRK